MDLPADGAASRCGWAFVALALTWTWGFGFAAVALDASAGHPLHLIALVGPAIAWAGVLTVGVPHGARGSFLRRVVDVRAVSPLWWCAVLAVGVGPGLIGATAGAVDPGGTALEPSLALAGALGALAFAAAAGLAEEPGWRGLVVDGVLARHPSVGLGLTLGLIWTAWHLPLYFIDGTYQAGLGLGSVEFWAALVGPVPLSLLLVWLVAGTRGAIVAAVVAHGLGNLTGELLATGSVAAIAELIALSVTAGAVVHRGGWRRDLRALSQAEHLPDRR
jgi:uncharacterized protein